MVAIFTRSLSDNLASLVKQVDTAIEKNKDKKLSAFVVYLTDDPDAAEAKLQDFAEKHGIKNVPLTVFDGVAGPPKYRIAQEAEVTVLMWVKQTVRVNHAFGAGELTPEAVRDVVADIPKILD